MSAYLNIRNAASDLINRIAENSGFSLNVTVISSSEDDYGITSSASSSSNTLKAIVNQVRESSRIEQGAYLKPGDAILTCEGGAGVNRGDIVSIDDTNFEVISVSIDAVKALSTIVCRKIL